MTYEELMAADARGELGPRYSGDNEFMYFKWPDVFLDLIPMAHRWRQSYPWDTFAAAQWVIDKHPEGLLEREAYQEFMDCFGDPRKNEKRTRSIPVKTRRKVLAAGECVSCGATEDLAVDHKRPFSRGGSHHASNLQCLCRSCNSSKGARTPEEWNV